eukprot:gene12732-biopygen9043
MTCSYSASLRLQPGNLAWKTSKDVHVNRVQVEVINGVVGEAGDNARWLMGEQVCGVVDAIADLRPPGVPPEIHRISKKPLPRAAFGAELDPEIPAINIPPPPDRWTRFSSSLAPNRFRPGRGVFTTPVMIGGNGSIMSRFYGTHPIDVAPFVIINMLKEMPKSDGPGLSAPVLIQGVVPASFPKSPYRTRHPGDVSDGAGEMAWPDGGRTQQAATCDRSEGPDVVAGSPQIRRTVVIHRRVRGVLDPRPEQQAKAWPDLWLRDSQSAIIGGRSRTVQPLPVPQPCSGGWESADSTGRRDGNPLSTGICFAASP